MLLICNLTWQDQCRYVRHALGGPTISEHEMSKNKVAELEAKYDLLLKQHEEACRQVIIFTLKKKINNK